MRIPLWLKWLSWRVWLKYWFMPLAMAAALVFVGLPWWSAPIVAVVTFFVTVLTSALLDLPEHPAMTPTLMRHAHWLLMAFTWLATYLLARDREVALGFYEATAQIAPVLLLALVVEAQFAARSRDERPLVLWVTLAILMAAAGSLIPLATGDPSDTNFGAVVAGMAAATVGLTLPAILRPESSDSDSDS